ncbi:hypothetical protein G7Y79_00004g014890 [Physcia stellaris]|nr:hypothetical protein G7Y79_00004g014890 [Physcia stellaris]
MDQSLPEKHHDHFTSDEDDTEDPTEHDRNLLEDEEEQQEKLLTRSRELGNRTGRDQCSVKHGRRAKKKERRRLLKGTRRKNGTTDEEGKLLYEMEEGGSRDDLSSSSSSSAELNKLNDQPSESSKRRRRARNISVSLLITSVFLLLAYGSYRMSYKKSPKLSLSTLSNGTSSFAPTTILISLDGFRADFVHRNITPALNSFIANGVSPKYMLPSFPSVTFPNHYTLVTGLHPESHGVVGNSFWDPDLGEEFFYTDPERSMQPKWWTGGEPLWVTAEKQGVTTAIHMWPGSEAHIQLEPTYLDKYNGSEILSRKVDRILELLDLPEQGDFEMEGAQTRPQLIAAYVPVVDADGHKHGPNSTEIRKTIGDVDSMLHNLFAGLDERNLSQIVNIVVVSDHGMATTSVDRLIQLDNLIDLNLVEHIDGWPLYGLRPKNSIDLQPLYEKLREESATNPNFEVYLRDENMPERYHFSKNDRIAPLWVIPKTGWAIVHKEDFDVKAAKANGEIYHPKGLHGYDHEHPLMRAIFVARGPAFPHKPNSKLAPFQNLEVYNIVCDSLGIEPKPNNGTLRLPLQPDGLHSDEPALPEDLPIDLPATIPAETPTVAVPSSASYAPAPTASTAANETQTNDESGKDSDGSLWGKWKQMMEDVKAAMADLVAKLHGGSDDT